jgi:hypothetical protein
MGQTLPIAVLRLSDAQAQRYWQDPLIRERVRQSCARHARVVTRVQVVGQGRLMQTFTVTPTSTQTPPRSES